MRNKILCGIRNLRLACARSIGFDFATRGRTVLLAASGRSGSTWIQNLITNGRRFRILFEPFHTEMVAAFDSWEWKQYIARGDIGDKYRRQIRRVIDGRIRHTWINQDNRYIFARRRLIKAIHSNLFLGWLKVNFPEIRVIILLRNPFDVAASRIRAGWTPNLQQLINQQDLMDQHFPNDKPFFESIDDPYVKHVAEWAIDNLVALRELDVGEAFVIGYEEICEDWVKCQKKLCNYLGLDPLNMTETDFLKKSRTTVPGGRINPDSTKGDSTKLAKEVLVRLGLDSLYHDRDAGVPRLSERNILGQFKPPVAS